MKRAVIAVSLFLWTGPVFADPCEALLPKAGTIFSGAIRYIGDGDGLCVGPAERPDRWIEIRLSDFYAPELHKPRGRDANDRLNRLAFGQTLVCRAGRRSYDRVVAACTLAGRPLGDLLRAAGGVEGGRAYRPRR